MGFFAVFGLFLLTISSAISEEVASQVLIPPCAENDFKCIEEYGNAFAELAGDGIGPPYNVKPTDPIEVASLDVPACCDNPPTGMIHLKNIKVYGLKHAKLVGLRLDKETNTVNANRTVNYRMVSDIVYEYIGQDKSYSGTMEVTNANVETSSTYVIAIEKDENGEEHVKVGPETTTCTTQGDPVVKFNAELETALNSDPEVRAKREQQSKELAERRRKFACRINAMAMPKFFDAWRQYTKVLKLSDMITTTNQ